MFNNLTFALAALAAIEQATALRLHLAEEDLLLESGQGSDKCTFYSGTPVMKKNANCLNEAYHANIPGFTAWCETDAALAFSDEGLTTELVEQDRGYQNEIVDYELTQFDTPVGALNCASYTGAGNTWNAEEDDEWHNIMTTITHSFTDADGQVNEQYHRSIWRSQKGQKLEDGNATDDQYISDGKASYLKVPMDSETFKNEVNGVTASVTIDMDHFSTGAYAVAYENADCTGSQHAFTGGKGFDVGFSIPNIVEVDIMPALGGSDGGSTSGPVRTGRTSRRLAQTETEVAAGQEVTVTWQNQSPKSFKLYNGARLLVSSGDYFYNGSDLASSALEVTANQNECVANPKLPLGKWAQIEE